MKMSCIKFLNNVVSSLHMHYFGGCSLRYVKYICALPPRPARTLNFFSRPYLVLKNEVSITEVLKIYLIYEYSPDVFNF